MITPSEDTALPDAALRAFARGEFALAADLLRPYAENGDIKAQVLLSRMYYAGNGVPQDHQQYRYWLEQAANLGDKASRAKLKRLNSSQQQ